MKKWLAVWVLLFATGLCQSVMADCADDAIGACNKKHPDPDQSDHAYGLYETCVKAKIGQQCPKSTAGRMVTRDVEKSRKGITPRCPAGYELRVDWKGRVDWCMKSHNRYFSKSAR